MDLADTALNHKSGEGQAFGTLPPRKILLPCGAASAHRAFLVA
jgi:hypothetical protein